MREKILIEGSIEGMNTINCNMHNDQRPSICGATVGDNVQTIRPKSTLNPLSVWIPAN